MAEGNPGDVFLQHSGAVLDALLSNVAVPAPSAPASGSASTPIGTTAASESTAAPTSSGGPAGGLPAPPGMPSASERINAILNRMAEPTRVVAPEVSTMTLPTKPSPVAAPPMAPHPPPPTSPAAEAVRRARTRLARSPTLVLTLAGLAMLIIIILAFVGCQPSSPGNSMVVVSSTAQAPASSDSAAVTDGPIQVRAATSECPPGSTSAMDAFDGQEGKAWDCVRAYHVDGQILTIDLGKAYAVTSISIVPGWDHLDADGTDEWTKHRTAEKVSYQFDDANETTYTQETMNQRKEVTTKIDPPVTATGIIVTILNSTGDPALNDTAISSIVITGH